MKVLQIGKFYPIRGGVEKVMYDLMLGLSDRQISCDMLCATTEDHPGGTLILGSYARVLAKRTQIKLAATMISTAMISTMRKIANRYDIVHIHHPDPMASLALLLSGFKGKVVLHWHSDILKQKTLLKLYGPLQRWLIRRADVIVGTSPVYVRCSPFLRKVQDKLDYIPIGIQSLPADKQQVDKIRQCYKGKFLIFSLGRLVSYKGYAYLIQAAQHLDERFQIIIGGKGPLETDLAQLIIDCGVQNRVELLGYIADEALPAYYEACDLFCLSSVMKTEAFAIVQLEAMSCGKPVISTQIPESGVSWVNAHGESGWVVPVQNARALADAMQGIMENNDQYAQLSRGALERYTGNFTRDHMVDKCLEIYNRVLNEKLVEAV